MDSDPVILALIDLIYATAADPGRWEELLKRLALVMKGNIATLHHQHPTALEGTIAVNWNLDPACLSQYTAYYAPLNLWFSRWQQMRRRPDVYTTQTLCPQELIVRSEFYNDWARLYGMQQGAGAAIFQSDAVSTVLSIFRLKKDAPFEESELALLRTLRPHLQRALQLHNRIQALEHKGSAAADALNHLRQGVVLLDPNGRTVMINQAATTLFATEQALRLTSRGLIAANALENKMLNQLIKGACVTGRGNGLHPGGAMSVSRDSFRRPLQILVMPLRTRTLQLGKMQPVVAIFISDPDRKLISQAQMFSQLYGFTPAEARLAQILCCGDSLKAASEQLGVTLGTLRSQLKSIFAKTNTNRQSQLVGLLLLAPAHAGQS